MQDGEVEKISREEFEEFQKVVRQEYENNILKNLRDAVADAYVPLFPPAAPTNVSPKIERLLAYLTYAITLHLRDEEEGWWEEDETIQEFDMLFPG
jgi:hypothetical protein